MEDFTPLADDQLATDAQTAGAGYSGARTVSDAILAQEYEYWKANRLKDCTASSTGTRGSSRAGAP